jgi:hypothetical protein
MDVVATDLAYTTVQIKFWEARDYPNLSRSVGRRRGCAWGGSTPPNCSRRAEYTLKGEHRVAWAACGHHMEMFVRNKIRKSQQQRDPV